MINTKKAFTLVELIVVITILAILGTIAFISLQGYSADARNSKRTNDLNNIAGSINIKTTEGVGLISFVTPVADTLVASASIAGTGTLATNYQAGNPNYTALNIKADDFKDPNGQEYKIGVTTYKNGQFEVAASMENGNGDKTAKINGTYKDRQSTQITAASTGTFTVTLKDADINTLLKGDYIGDGTSTGQITKVSSDNKTLTTSVQINSLNIKLAASESAGLISKKGGSSTPVVNDGADLPY